MAAGSSTELPTTSRKRKADASWDLTTGQDALNLAMYKYLPETTDASKPEDVNGFVRYLEHERKVVIVDVQPGSLIITVERGSLQKLEELWKDYHAGCVNETAQKFLLTKEILNELGLLQVKLSTSIPDEEYSHCQKLLRTFDGECNYFYKYAVPLPLIRTYFSRCLAESGSLLSCSALLDQIAFFMDSHQSSRFKNLCYANQIRKKKPGGLHKCVFFFAFIVLLSGSAGKDLSLSEGDNDLSILSIRESTSGRNIEQTSVVTRFYALSPNLTLWPT